MIMLILPFIIIFLGAAAWLLWPRPQELQHEPSGRRAAAARQSEPGPRVGLGAVVGVVAGRVVNSIEDARAGFLRTRDMHAMSRYEDGDDTKTERWPDPAPETRSPVPGPAPAQPGPGDDEPDYIIRATRAQALEMFFTRGGTWQDLELLQEGDAAAIRRAMALQIPRRVIAQIAGGQKARRMEESAAAMKERAGDGVA